MPDATLLTLPSVVKPFPDPIPQVIPFGSICLFAGASGSGKTIFQSEWVKRWIDGRTICGHPTNCPTGFYYLAADRDWSTYAAAFASAGVPDDRIVRYVLAEDLSWKPEEWLKLQPFDFLLKCLLKLTPIPGSLVFIDPMAPLFVHGDQNRARDVAISMHFLRRMTRQFNCSIIANANVVKAKIDEGHKRPQDRIVGSGAFVAYTDTQIYLVEGDEPGDPRTLGWTPRRGQAEQWQFDFDQDTKLFIPHLPERAAQRKHEQQSLEGTRQAGILQLIPEEGIMRKDLEAKALDQFKVARTTVHRDLQILKQHRLIYWDVSHFGLIKRRKQGETPVPEPGPYHTP